MTEHKQVLIENPVGEFIPIDEGISELIKELWKRDIYTYNSCQENEPGIIWIEFANSYDAKVFLDTIMLKAYEDEGYGDELYFRMYVNTFHEKDWQYDVCVIDYNEIIDEEKDELVHVGIPDIGFPISIRFPISDYHMVLKIIKEAPINKTAIVSTN